MIISGETTEAFLSRVRGIQRALIENLTVETTEEGQIIYSYKENLNYDAASIAFSQRYATIAEGKTAEEVFAWIQQNETIEFNEAISIYGDLDDEFFDGIYTLIK